MKYQSQQKYRSSYSILKLMIAFIFTFTVPQSYGQFYAGGGIGYSDLDFSISAPPPQSTIPIIVGFNNSTMIPGTLSTTANLSQSDNGFGTNIFAGFEWTPRIAIELAYIDLGKTEHVIKSTTTLTLDTTGFSLPPGFISTSTSNIKQKLNLKTTGFAIYGVFKYPMSVFLSPFIKIGAYNWKEKPSTSTTASNFIIRQPFVPSPKKESGTELSVAIGAEYLMTRNIFISLGLNHFRKINDRDINYLNFNIKYYFK